MKRPDLTHRLTHYLIEAMLEAEGTIITYSFTVLHIIIITSSIKYTQVEYQSTPHRIRSS